MRIESKLCHLSENKAVVHVNGWINDKSIGSALGEGSTAELAEDKAIIRLEKRLIKYNDNDDTIKRFNENQIKNKVQVELSKSDNLESYEINQEPCDWSNELTAIDAEIARLNWTRDDEMSFLDKNLGYKSRNKITNYNELVKYLKILKNIDNLNTTKLNTLNIKDLIDESDLILQDLSWDNKQGREYLMREFNVSARRELNEIQLLSFVEKLRSIRNDLLTN